MIIFKNWGDEIYLRYCEKMTADQRHQEFENYPNSVNKILLHMYGAQYGWLEDIGVELIPEDWDNWKDLEFEKIISGIRTTNQKILEYIDYQDLNKKHIIDWEKDKKPVETTAEKIIFNLVTHNAYHKGQIAVFLRMLGWEEIKETDYNPYTYLMGQNE